MTKIYLKGDLRRFLCFDCNRRFRGTPQHIRRKLPKGLPICEDFSVRDDLYTLIVPVQVNVCLDCFEKRLGRSLEEQDLFSPNRVNDAVRERIRLRRHLRK